MASNALVGGEIEHDLTGDSQVTREMESGAWAADARDWVEHYILREGRG